MAFTDDSDFQFFPIDFFKKDNGDKMVYEKMIDDSPIQNDIFEDINDYDLSLYNEDDDEDYEAVTEA